MLEVAKKYALIFPSQHKSKISEILEEIGSFEIVEEKGWQEKNIFQEIDYEISVLAFAINYLIPYQKKESFFQKIKVPKILFKKEDVFSFLRKKEEILNKTKRLEEIEKELDLIRKRRQELENKLKTISEFELLKFLPQETKFFSSFLTDISPKKEKELLEFVQINKVAVFKIGQHRGNLRYLFITPFEIKNKLLEEFNLTIVNYPFEKIPSEEKKETLKERGFLREKEKKLKEEIILLANHLRDFQILHDFLVKSKAKLEIERLSKEKQLFSYVIFWAEKERKEELEKEISRLFKDCFIIETKAEENEEPPVLLKNNKYFKPFEYVTEIFGLPRFDEIDPTPYFALFFITFFGIALTDAAYGLLLLIISLFSLKFFSNFFLDKKLLTLLFCGGISTFIMGVIFGSYFGITPQIPIFLRLKKIDPIEDTILFMGLTFVLGYLQSVFAQVVKIIKAKKQKDKKTIFGAIAWLSFYLSLTFLVLNRYFLFLKKITLPAILATIFFVIYSETIGQKIFILLRFFIGGIKFIQGIISTTADILSYSRLMALGLATAVIALIINQIAFLFGKMIPYFGWLVALVILVIGHVFNLVINALSAFIHSGRLQFVEFFPKFLEGGGRRLKPKRSNLRYIQIVK